jgi:predicted nucleic acid-binding protein
MRLRLRAGEIATTDMVITEVLAGASGAAQLARLEDALTACEYLAQRRLADAVAAAGVYRDCRNGGETPRQITDCLIAAVAIRNGRPVLQQDRDYDVIARHTSLQTASR